MLFTVKEDLDLCIEFNINAGQLMFIKMLIPNLSLDQPDRKRESYALSMKFSNEIKGIPLKDLQDLIYKDIIIDLNDHGNTHYEYYEINPKFYYKFSLKIYPMVNELHDVYPDFFHDAAGKRYVAKGCSAQEIALDYLKAIKNDPKEHAKIMDDIAWAKTNNFIVMGLKKFVAAKYWSGLRELRIKQGAYKIHVNARVI